jgi:hypothetical protein
MLLDEFWLAVIGRFAIMPVLTLAAMAATNVVKGRESTVFEYFSVAASLGGAVSSVATMGLLEHWLHAPAAGSPPTDDIVKLVVFCAIARFAPLVVMQSLVR